MQTLVIYPGRFHPFHRGHKMVYDWLVKNYGTESVYIATSNSQAPLTSPFNFDEKYTMMTSLGVPSDKVVQVKNPYQAKEIKDNFDPTETRLIFAVSEKDSERFSFAPKKDGSPGYLQPLDDTSNRPFSEQGYVTLVPTFTFKVAGQDANSATQIRARYIEGNNQDRAQIIHDLYGRVDPKIKDIFDRKLSKSAQVQEYVQQIRTSGLTEGKIAWLEKVLVLESLVHEEMNPGILTESVDHPGDYIAERCYQNQKPAGPARRYRK